MVKKLNLNQSKLEQIQLQLVDKVDKGPPHCKTNALTMSTTLHTSLQIKLLICHSVKYKQHKVLLVITYSSCIPFL